MGRLETENENERYAAAKEKLLGDKIPELHWDIMANDKKGSSLTKKIRLKSENKWCAYG